MQSITIGANPFAFEDSGTRPALLLLSGWCQDHRLFKHLAPELANTNRVIQMDWRGHDATRQYDGDFTTDDQASDVIALMDHLKLESVVPVSTSHGGWANLEICDRVGAKRVPRSIVIDWIMVSPGEAFYTMIDDLQVRENWEKGRKEFFNNWIVDTDNQDVINHVNDEMASFDFEMWARSGREIAKGYRKWGSPMQRMAALKETIPVSHIYSQPVDPEYTRAQLDFAASHPWFSPHKLVGKTHFPTLEQPMNVAAAIRNSLA
jgi:pimeloyl-ACP methyl ester carboxylesterase